eukprot:TRINITY_DN511_c0_g2_i1.p1 TRINITY_DN511_c0_g2~~TRINITY_DN511_c0_g2_i1.p1  ORF type:complete len:245 (+),score=13.78 TRINITY_DN511_c0_g2_i1:233-967(+)
MPNSETDGDEVQIVEAETTGLGFDSEGRGYEEMDEEIESQRGTVREIVPPPPWSKRLHNVMVGSLSFSSILLIMIIATRSWGVGQVQRHEMSAGVWEVCSNHHIYRNSEQDCVSWEIFCPPVEGLASASAVFSILSLLTALLMVAINAFEMVRPGTFRLHHITMTILNHLLYIFVLLSWTLWTALMPVDCGSGHAFGLSPGYTPHGHLWYSWGYIFLICIFMVHLTTALFLTLQQCGIRLPCGL